MISPDRDKTLCRYKTLIESYPRLSGKEERLLYLEWRNKGNIASRDKLLHTNLRHVFAVAWQYRGYHIPLEDLIAEGMIGLMRALDKFDPSRNIRFSTYMTFWARAYILIFILHGWSLVYDPNSRRSGLFFRLRRQYTKFIHLVGDREAAEKLTAERLGLPLKKVQSALHRIESRDAPLDAQIPESDDRTTFMDLLVDPQPGQDEQLHARREQLLNKLLLRNAIRTLDPREQYIVENHLMAEEALSLAEIGRRLGVSRERARQLETRALYKLKKCMTVGMTQHPIPSRGFRRLDDPGVSLA